MKPFAPDISVVIPTCNRIRQLPEVLDHLHAQSLERERFEVILVDDGSTDGTVDLLASLKQRWNGRLLAFRQDHGFSGAARNLGIRAARGRLILSMDDDILAERNMLRRHLELHRRYPDLETAVVGRVVTGSSGVDLCDPDDRAIPVLRKTIYGDAVVGPSAFTTQNISMKREFIIECGMFTPGLERLDDLDLAFRMRRKGLRLIYSPDALGIHIRPLDTLDKVIEMGERYGRTLAAHYDRLPWIPDEITNLGARLDGGVKEFRGAPAAYCKDALRRLLINRMTIGPLVRATRRMPVSNPPSALLVRCCREIWAFHYRDAFRRNRRVGSRLQFHKTAQIDTAGRH